MSEESAKIEEPTEAAPLDFDAFVNDFVEKHTVDGEGNVVPAKEKVEKDAPAEDGKENEPTSILSRSNREYIKSLPLADQQELAREIGWRKTGGRPAFEFLMAGEDRFISTKVLAHQQSKMIDRLRQEHEAFKASYEKDVSSRVATERKQIEATLQAQLEDAIGTGDAQKAAGLLKMQRELLAAEGDKQKSGGLLPEDKAYLDTFVDKNPWYNSDPAKKTLADSLYVKYAQSVPYKEAVRLATLEMSAHYPDDVDMSFAGLPSRKAAAPKEENKAVKPPANPGASDPPAKGESSISLANLSPFGLECLKVSKDCAGKKELNMKVWLANATPQYFKK